MFFYTKQSLCAAIVGMALVAPAAQAETTIRYMGLSKLDMLDPIWTTNYGVRDHGYLIYDTLFAQDAEGNIKPQMIDTWTVSEDRMAYRFSLRDGLMFHDGAPVTSQDVVASLERWMHKDTFGVEIKNRLSSMDVVDDKIFTLSLTEPFGLVVDAFGKTASNVPFIMPARIASGAVDDQISDPVGSGPFKFILDDWQPGVKAVYEKFEAYVPRDEAPSGLAGGKVAMVDRIERVFFPDDITAVNALATGEIDYIPQFQPDLIPILSGASDVVVQPHNPLGQTIQIIPNFLQPPTDDVRIRQAMQLALGQEDYMTAILGSYDELYSYCPSIFMCGTALENDANSERQMSQDVEAAKALLAEAGYDGTPLTLLHATDVSDQRTGGSVTAQRLREAGFVVDDVVSDWATIAQRRANKAPIAEGGWNIFQTGWDGMALQSPLTNVYVSGACDDAWYGWNCSETLQRLKQDYINATSVDEQKTIGEAMQQEAYEIVSVIMMGQYTQASAWSANLEGMRQATVTTNLWGVSKAE
ncbi:peptide/nickel transport system substrate-binding protein [Pacificibacter maritimus]|uniref:Peptide/nickel transport system substrate-binding protein n=1 Tax=Pacificibacter maritimus TaxID=762213 RepID=A0A3N4UX98_9RHOB|nr:ABC transporter substrate-binding protein [Pacificibacter maritimus]RPE72169.1 peptide/nickel transport system substrate-binding protein [Pacificibacter maritimus]